MENPEDAKSLKIQVLRAFLVCKPGKMRQDQSVSHEQNGEPILPLCPLRIISQNTGIQHLPDIIEADAFTVSVLMSQFWYTDLNNVNLCTAMNNSQNSQLLNSLLEIPVETEWLELKAARNSFSDDDLGKYVTALANGAALKNEPFGYLILGVDDKTHSIVGSLALSSEKLKNEAKLNLFRYANPHVQVEFIDVQATPGKAVRILQITKPTTAVSWKGHYYGRSGESVTPLGIEQIEQISILRDWSAEPCPDATVADLSPEAITKGRTEFKRSRPALANYVNEWSDEEFLTRIGLIVRGKLTNAAIILFGSPESESLLSPKTSRISWFLVNDGMPESYEHFYCPLIINADKALEKIRNKKIASLPNGTMFPEELFQYDPWLLRETLANAIAHQDYSACQHITIKESAQGEYVTIANAGKFIPGTVENVLKSFEPCRYIRNRLLVDAMIKVKMMESANSGILRMFTVQRNNHLPLPEYSISGNGVSVTLSGKLPSQDALALFSTYGNLPVYDLHLMNKLLSDGAKSLTREQIAYLKDKNLISSSQPYRLKGLKKDLVLKTDNHFKDDDKLVAAIQCFLKEKKEKGALKGEIIDALDTRLPNQLTASQREHKVKNLLQIMRKNGIIELGPKRNWKILSDTDI